MPWSDWQPAFDFVVPANWADQDGVPQTGRRDLGLNSDFSQATGLASLADALAAIPGGFASAASPTGNIQDGGFGGENFQATCDVAAGVESSIVAQVFLDQYLATFIDPDYSGYQPDPPVPEGVTVWEYEAGGSVRLAWQDWTLDAATNFEIVGQDETDTEGPAATLEYYGDYTGGFSFRLVDPTVASYAQVYNSEIGGHGTSGEFPSTSWPASGIGSELLRASLPFSTSGPVTLPPPVTVPLATVGTDASFTLVIQPASMLDGCPATHAPTTDPSDTTRGWSLTDFFSPDVPFQPVPPLLIYRTPRWRYAPILRTVGGYWDTPGGAPVKSLIDGDWQTVIDVH